jgi:hypothetical protein
MSLQKLAWLILSVFFLIEGLAHSQTSRKKEQEPTINHTKEWRVVDGFRSAKFGMDENQVLQAIIKDFKVPKEMIARGSNPTEKTTHLVISLNNLILPGGVTQINYSLGHKSKRLKRVNLYWGEGVSEKIDPELVTAVANILSTYFKKKRFKKEKYLLGGKFSDGTICVFRGLDKNDRMIFLTLHTLNSKKNDKKKRIRLKLSYLQNYRDPDIFSSKDK